MLRRITFIAILITVSGLLDLRAQEAISYWVTAENDTPGQQILLRRTFSGDMPQGTTHLLVAATGSYNLYINGRIAYSSFRFDMTGSGRQDNESAATDGLLLRDIDVSAYILPGDNVVAAWLAPSNITAGEPEYPEKPLFFADIYVCDGSGNITFYPDDYPWLWTEANAVSLADGEYIDARDEVVGWNGAPLEEIVRWRPARQEKPIWLPTTSFLESASRSDYARKVVRPRFFSRSDDGKSIVYDFGKGFYGTVRATFRNAKSGEHVFINGSEYVCSGKFDEQFVGRFVASGCRKLRIEGDKSFSISHVSAVEGIAVSAEKP